MQLTGFSGQNFLITPAAAAVGEPPPRNILDQKYLLILTGVAVANLEGNSADQWLYETLSFLPAMAGPQNSGPLNWAINRFSIPRPSVPNYTVGFSLDEWAPFVSLSSIFDQYQSINAGFAVNVWRPTPFATGADAFTNQPVGNIFTGVDVDVAVRDSDAWIYKIAYNVSLLGKIVFLAAPQIVFDSNFDLTADGQPPATTQSVGTATVSGPAGSVVVVDPPFAHTARWLQVSRPNGQDLAIFVGEFSSSPGVGVYTFSAMIFMPSGSGLASISFETATQLEFLHLDFMQNNKVRIDDIDGTEFGVFPRNQPFLVTVTLNINAAQSTVKVVLSGAGASGQTSYNVQFNALAPQFGAIQIWQGFPWTGAFDVTNILVTYTP